MEISGRGKSGRVVHALDVDLDMGRLKSALEAMGDTQEARKCAKDIRAMLRTGRTCGDGRMRYRLEYRHSELGRDLMEAGHVRDSRVYVKGADPFKWARPLRRAALHGVWEADDTACFPTARQAMVGTQGGHAAHFLEERKAILNMVGSVMFGDQLSPEERRSRVKRITTAYDMGASLDFWRDDNPEAVVLTLRGCGVLAGNRIFSIEGYRSELAEAGVRMAERADSMLEYLRQPDTWAKKTRRGARKRVRSRPEVTLRSYLLQEAEAVGREAKLTTAEAMGLRVVNLQHDGVAIEGMQEGGEAEVVSRLSDSVTRACGYTAGVTVERVG